MSRLKELIHEIHRRSLWQVLGIYLASSWVVFEVVQTLTEGVGLPGWVPSGALVALLIGLPIVMATAFVQEGMGGRRAETVPAEPESPANEAAVTADKSSEPKAVGGGVRHRLFTWRNALLGGAATFALLGVVTAGYMAMRALGIGPAGTLVAKGVLEERTTVVLADFAAADTGLARAATEAFRVDLSQSRVVRLAERGLIRDALARMERDRSSGLDGEAAREIAVREGFPAVISGEIVRAGPGWVFSTELLSASDGSVLVSQRVSAADSSEILGAIDDLSERLRERIGESLAQIRDDPPLSRVTTSDLEALEKFSQASRAFYVEGDLERAIDLLEEAVRRDTAFASAWASLATALSNVGENRSLQVEALERAYRHRDRLTEEERYALIGHYHAQVRGEPEKAVQAFESLLAIDPENQLALGNLSDLYLNLRDYERAESLARRAIQVDSTHVAPYWNAAEAQARLGRIEDAVSTFEAFLSHAPENPYAQSLIAHLRASRGEYSRAEESFQEIRETQVGDLFWRYLTAVDLAAVEAVRGRVTDGAGWLEGAEATQEERGLPGEALRNVIWTSLLEVRVLQDPATALARVEEALSRRPLATLAALDRPYAELAELLATAGALDRARDLLEDMRSVLRPEVRPGTSAYPYFKLNLQSAERARAEIALADGRYEEAIQAFRRSDSGYCRLCGLPGLARAYDAAGRRDSALAVYERYLNTPGPFRLWTGDAFYRGPIQERLALLYDEEGDPENAAKYYAQFVELWKDADPELQPRVEAAQERLEEIVAKRG